MQRNLEFSFVFPERYSEFPGPPPGSLRRMGSSSSSFKKIVAKWGRLEADLFASHKNAKLDIFLSMNPKGAWAADTLLNTWLFSLLTPSPSTPDPQMYTEVPQRASGGDSCGSLLAEEGLVFEPVQQPWLLPLQADLLSQGPVLGHYGKQMENLLVLFASKGKGIQINPCMFDSPSNMESYSSKGIYLLL